MQNLQTDKREQFLFGKIVHSILTVLLVYCMLDFISIVLNVIYFIVNGKCTLYTVKFLISFQYNNSRNKELLFKTNQHLI